MTEAETELIRAVKRGDTKAIQDLIRSGADVNCSDNQGWTPLFHAAGTGNSDIMRLLIAIGADVDSHRANGFTPLFAAILSRHLNAIRVLLDAGASSDAPEGDSLVRHVPSDWKHQEEAIQLLHMPTKRPNQVQRTAGRTDA